MKKDVIEFLDDANQPPQLTTTDEGYDINEAREMFIARVESEGFRVVLPADNELLIDIDTEQHYATFLRSLESVVRNVGNFSDWRIEAHPSKSGLPRQHITISLPFAVDPYERIAWQAALGSDPMRELLSAIRLMRGDAHPTLFVELGAHMTDGVIPKPEAL